MWTPQSPFQLLPQSRSSLLSSIWTDCLPGNIIKVQVFSIPALHRLPAFCHQCPRTTLIFVVTIDVFSKSAAQTLLRLKTFVLCSFHVFHHFFHEARCLIFLFFPFEESFWLVAKLFPIPFVFLFVWGKRRKGKKIEKGDKVENKWKKGVKREEKREKSKKNMGKRRVGE